MKALLRDGEVILRRTTKGTQSRRITVVLICFFILSAVGCAGRIDEDSERSQRDERIATQVKVALVRVPELSAAPIDVTARDGVVILTGFVETEAQREQAAKAAGAVLGVRALTNNIEVK